MGQWSRQDTRSGFETAETQDHGDREAHERSLRRGQEGTCRAERNGLESRWNPSRSLGLGIDHRLECATLGRPGNHHDKT